MNCSWWRVVTAGCLLLLGVAVAVAAPPEKKKAASGSAREMMVRAHQARAQWKDFPGFQADVVIVVENKRLRRKLTVTPELELQWNQPLPPAFTGAERRLLSVVQHREANQGQQYDVELVWEKGRHALGRLIRFKNDAMHSQYRIRGDVITQVSRRTPHGSFTITVLQVIRNPEKKYLPRVYTVTFFGKTTAPPGSQGEGEMTVVQRSSVVMLDWERVGRWDLPRQIRSVNSSPAGVKMEVIRLQNHRLLEAAK